MFDRFSKKSDKSENVVQDSPSDTDHNKNEPTQANTDFQEVNDGSEGNIFNQNGKSYRTLNRWDTILILFTNQIGLGILSMPSVMKTLGIIPGIIAIIGLGVLTWYTSYEFLQFYRKHPHVVSIVEMAGVVGGKWFETVAGIVMTIQVVFIVASAVVTLSVALNTLSNHAVCTVVFILIACIACYLLSLPRTMKFVSKAGIPNAVSVLAACLIVLISLAIKGPAAAPEGWVKDIQIVGNPSFRDGLNACLRVAFAYAGNFTFVSYMAEMVNPQRDFKFCLAFLQIGSMVFYIIIAVVLYCLSAQYTTSPVLSAASAIPAKVAYGVVLPAVVATALSIGHTGSKYFYVAAMKQMGALHQITDNSAKSWITWLSCVSVFWVVIFTISNVIPIFDSILSITSSTTIPWFSFGLAAIFWFHMNWDCLFANWKKASLTVLNIFIIGATLFLNAGGLWAAVTELLDLFNKDDGSIGGVFSCGNNALF